MLHWVGRQNSIPRQLTWPQSSIVTGQQQEICQNQPGTQALTVTHCQLLYKSSFRALICWYRVARFIRPEGEKCPNKQVDFKSGLEPSVGCYSLAKFWKKTLHSKGWHFTLFPISPWHQDKSSVLVWGPCTKMQPWFWCQRAVGNNLNGQPVHEPWIL